MLTVLECPAVFSYWNSAASAVYRSCQNLHFLNISFFFFFQTCNLWIFCPPGLHTSDMTENYELGCWKWHISTVTALFVSSLIRCLYILSWDIGKILQCWKLHTAPLKYGNIYNSFLMLWWILCSIFQHKYYYQTVYCSVFSPCSILRSAMMYVFA